MVTRQSSTRRRGAALPLALMGIWFALVTAALVYLATTGPAPRDESSPAATRAEIMLGAATPDSTARTVSPPQDGAKPGRADATIRKMPPAPAPERQPTPPREPSPETAISPPPAPGAPNSAPPHATAPEPTQSENPASRTLAPPTSAPAPPPPASAAAPTPAPTDQPAADTPAVPLPTIGADGRGNWQRYARPFDRGDARPRIAVVIIGLGLSDAATETAIQGLPGAVTLGFWPYARRLDHWIRLARAAGHEVLINLPMEPGDYPRHDPGPRTLLSTLTPEENMDRLNWVLSRVAGYVGVADSFGTRFTASKRNLSPILQALRERGLMYYDGVASVQGLAPTIAQEIGLPYAARTRVIDRPASRRAIDTRLRDLERIAQARRFAVAQASPYPVTLERIAAWAAQVESRGFALAPITAIAALSRDNG